MKYNIKKHQLGGTVLNSRVVSGLKNKDGRIGWDSNFNITQPNKQAVLLPNITVTPSTSNTNLQEEAEQWNKKYPQTTSEVPLIARPNGDRLSMQHQSKIIPVSGTDPIGQFIVEGVALGKPTQYLLDKSLQGLVGKTSGELLGQAWGFTRNSGKDFIKNSRDIKQLYNFAGKNSYRKPLVNPLSSSSVNRAYKNLLDQHNTFVRGVSTSERVLDDPIILNHLQEQGIYNPAISKNLQEEKLASYMSTHIPPDTGHGRYGLGQYENGLYTSKNINVAKNFAHERGYIATVKRPVNYSSNNRLDWIKSADYKTVPINATNDQRSILAQEFETKSNDILKRYLFDLPTNLSERYPNQPWGSRNNLLNTKRTDRLVKLQNEFTNKISLLHPDIKLASETLNGVPVQEYIFRGNVGDKPVELMNLQPIKPK